MFKSIWSVASWLGIAAGALSLVLLVKHGIDVSFTSSFQIIIDFYEQLTQALFGWIGSWINQQLAFLSAWVGWDLHVYSHWKHVFVLMAIYFSGDWRVLAAASMYRRAMIFAIWGFVNALGASVVAGMIRLDNIGHGFWPNAFVAMVPVFGYLIYAIGGNALLAKWADVPIGHNQIMFRRWLPGLFFRFSLGLLIIGTVLQLPLVKTLPQPGLTMLGFLVLVLASYWVLIGFVQSGKLASQPPPAGENRGWNTIFRDSFLRHGNTRVGLTILGAFAGCFLFIALNAGLKLAGL